jgi:hypothetical protein
VGVYGLFLGLAAAAVRESGRLVKAAGSDPVLAIASFRRVLASRLRRPGAGLDRGRELPLEART